MPAFEPYPYAIIKGNILPIEQASVSIMTNALHYGGGVFGGIKAYDTPGGIAIYRLSDHVERLKNSCKILRFPYNAKHQHLSDQIVALARKNNLTGKTYIRPLIYRSDLQLSPDISGDYDLAVYMLKMTDSYLAVNDGISVCVSPWIRNSDNAIPPRTKASGGYLNSALAIHDAKQAGYDSAIMLNQKGEVSEGAVMNIFIVKNGKLITPSCDADILEGITRRTVIELANEFSLPVIERPVSRSELYSADEVFFCGTAVEISWCKAIDKVVIGKNAGPITKKLLNAYENLPATHPQLYTII